MSRDDLLHLHSGWLLEYAEKLIEASSLGFWCSLKYRLKINPKVAFC